MTARGHSPAGATVVAALVAAWALAVHAATGVQVGYLVGMAALGGVAAYGVGHELGDPGLGAAVFLLMAAAGVIVAVVGAAGGMPAAELTVIFGTVPALVGAAGAWAGGRRAEG